MVYVQTARRPLEHSDLSELGCGALCPNIAAATGEISLFISLFISLYIRDLADLPNAFGVFAKWNWQICQIHLGFLAGRGRADLNVVTSANACSRAGEGAAPGSRGKLWKVSRGHPCLKCPRPEWRDYEERMTIELGKKSEFSIFFDKALNSPC